MSNITFTLHNSHLHNHRLKLNQMSIRFVIPAFFLVLFFALNTCIAKSNSLNGPTPTDKSHSLTLTEPKRPSIERQSIKRPNIVFVFSDDHAPHAIGAYSDRFKALNPTPNIDQLARDGMLFRNSFCTNSICGPSRAVILTGKHSHINGFRRNGNRFDGNQPTFPKMLQSAGYQTAMIGKWHLQSDPQGFDYWDVLIGQGQYYNPMLKSQSKKRRVNGYCTDLVTDLALDWLKKRDTSKPFLLMCQHKAPHRCWMPAPRHLTLYDDVQIPEPDTLFDDFKDNASPARRQEMEIDRHMDPVYDLFLDPPAGWSKDPGYPVDRSGFRNLKIMTPAQLKLWNQAYAPKNKKITEQKLTPKAYVQAKYQRYMKNYLRCIKGVDESLGKIRNFLHENKLDQNTIVIYSSDQGFYLGDHGWYDKRWMYEESLKMPLIVSWPGVTQPGKTNQQLVQNLDYAETFLDIAGAPIPNDMQGNSLVPLLKSQPSKWRDHIYYHYYEFPSVHMVSKHDGVRSKRYKLIHFYETDEWEFYDLKNDPDEKSNIYHQEGLSEIIERHKQKLIDLRTQYKVPTPKRAEPAK